MLNFEFLNPTQIIFGKDAEQQVGERTKAMGRKCLLHYGTASIKRTGLYDKVVASLKEAGVDYIELGGVQPNPILSLAREGAALCKKEGVDCVLAVGGGSAIDSAKVIAMGAVMEDDVWPIFIGKAAAPANTLPTGNVLTIPAAGSESSMFTVITNEDGLYKRGTSSPVLYPRFAIINPELSFTLSAYQIACGCVDIFAHCVERYFTTTENVDVSDRMLEGLMRSVLFHSPATVSNLTDYNSRAEICWAGSLAHNSLTDRGRATDWLSHGLGHEMSSLYGLTHGASLAIAIPAWMKYAYKHAPKRFLQFAVRVMDVDLAFENEDAAILEGIARLERFFVSIGMPIRMDGADIPTDSFREMAEKVVAFGRRGLIVSADANDCEAIYKLMV